MSFLGALLDFLFPPRDMQAQVNEATIESIGANVLARTHKTGSVTLLPYRTPLVRACVVEAKFRDSEKAQKLLGAILADYLLEHFETPLILVPIPLSKERLQTRGYNQVERIARTAVARSSHIQVNTDLLVRTRDTLPQTSLGRSARKRNLENAFALSRTPDPSYTYIVLDDVLTTGTTLRAALEAFSSVAGTSAHGLALAH